MNARALRFKNVAAAAVLIGGVLVVAVPRYAVTVVQLTILGAGISGAVHALAAHVPTAGWLSPFTWLSPFAVAGHLGRNRRQRSGVEHIRSRFRGRRQPVAHGPPMPPAVLRQLKPVIAAALNIDLGDPGQVASVRHRVSPLTYAILTCVPMERPTWLRTVRPNEGQVAGAVHHVLDDLGMPRADDLDRGTSLDFSPTRGT